MHTKTLDDGTLIDIDKLQLIIPIHGIFMVYIKDLKGISRLANTGFSSKRYDACDTSIPGIVDKHNNLLDGRHRACKLWDNGYCTIPVKLATDEDIQQCIMQDREI